MVIVLAEKPSAARNFARALGGRSGSFEGARYEVVSLMGHLMGLAAPERQVAGPLRERYASWRASDLPWDPSDFSWEREFRDEARRKVAEGLKDALEGADEVAIATDDDPTGEGELLAWEALLWAGWGGPTTRMHFVDESEREVQKAFRARAAIGSAEQDGDYLKAVARDRWDLLSMQLTRAATDVARSRGVDLVLRQGRLKSVMVSLVGDQQRAHDDYVKVPFFEVRYRDAAGNVLAPDEGAGLRRASADEVDLAPYGPSAIVVDGRERKRAAPPRLPDLAALSGALAARGHKAREVLDCYQRMYEDQVLSYPRTEDHHVTPEQFAELEPLTGAIAAVVGVDEALLTHRDPRPTHVHEDGAHGANRPGKRVPASLAELEGRYGKVAGDLYGLVARSWLATLAPDHLYERVSAHVEGHEEFSGVSLVTVEPGWRAVAAADDEGQDEANRSEWASPAEAYVHEGANRRPQAPTQRWLMRALERYEVGTGASRTQTFADCTSGGERALMSEARGRLALTPAGKASWTLLAGCEIASPEATERLMALMAAVGRGEATVDDVTATVEPLVKHDLAAMQGNAGNLATDAPRHPCPRCGQPLRRARSGRLWFCTSAKGHRDDGGAWVVDDAGCGFRLLTTVCGRELTERQVEQVLSGRPAHVCGLRSRKGTAFEADVVLDASSDFGTRLVFGERVRAGGGRGRR